MTKLVAKRSLLAAITLLSVSVLVFLGTAILPGDVVDAILGQSATPEAAAALRSKLNLNASPIDRYLGWLSGFLTGDLGTSLVNGQPVTSLIAIRLGSSLKLAGLATLFCLPIGLGLGILTAMSGGKAFDKTANVATLAIISVPEFFLGTLAVLIFSVQLGLFPAVTLTPDTSSVANTLRNFTLPVLALSGIIIAQMMRMTRAALLDELAKPYVEMARLKGVPKTRLVLAHALPNALGPIANAVALSLSHLLGGAIIIETVFNYPGLARLLVDSVSTRDIPLLQACTMLFCFAYLLLVIVADIISIVTNPRLKKQ